jgi:DNA-directed RNA polymerase beta subunit
MSEIEEKSVNLKITQFDYEIDPKFLYLVIDSLLEGGLVRHHLDSANNFYENGIKQIITQGFRIEKTIYNVLHATQEDKDIERIFCEVIPTEISLSSPGTLIYKTGKESMLFPKVALAREKVYSGPLFFSCEVKATAYYKDGTSFERTDTVNSFRVCKVPIVVKSTKCNLYNKSKEALMQMGEDPSDPGGYFIVKGEWAVDCTENITYNQPKIYINEGYGKSRVRCEYISKPGDTYQNSDYILLRFSNDDTLTIEIARDKLNGIQIPFYLIFRALGWSTDKEMFDWIVFDHENPANKSLDVIVRNALNAKYSKLPYATIYNQIDAIKAIVDMIPEELYKNLDLKNNPDKYHNAIQDVLRIFDSYCLPHIGTSPAARHTKLKFLGLLVRKTLLVHLRYIPPTDRDSYRNKRIHSAGDNYAKAFKTYYNQTVVMPIKRRMMKDFKQTSFRQVNLANLVKSAIYADEFERLIVQTIVSGNKSNLKIKKRSLTNRLSSQQLNRKNQTNLYATLRNVSATGSDQAKQSERASEMRRVHPSQIGYICLNHSPPEGEKVGINKQLAISATIANSSSSEILKKILLADPSIVLETTLTPLEIYRNNYARVYVNGYLIGYVLDSIELVSKYRYKRRTLDGINMHTTIYWDNTQNEVQFFVDMGRITRPLIIVYNNQRDKQAFDTVKGSGSKSKSKKGSADQPFEQGIAITADDLTQLFQMKKTIYDLVREQKVEFITPDEQENCYVCPNFKQLTRDRYDELNEYTHCDIPQAIEGITALTAPFGNFNQAPRVTYQTSQVKQTCGNYAMNWPFRMDKETFLQYTNETPLIRTVTNKYLFPNGNNVMVAIMCYTGLIGLQSC